MTRGRGVIYVATGEAHVAAARASARSVRASNPGLGIALFGDGAAAGGEFDEVRPVADPHRRSKVDCLGESPFAETLYLDGDTRVVDDLGDMFRLLERFDFAAAHRRKPAQRRPDQRWRENVPAAFPEHNGGVLLYRDSGPVRRFLANWRAAYHEAGFAPDQITFRETLWASDLRIAVLPVRFNTRRYNWLDHWRAGHIRPAILHLNRFHPSKRHRIGWLEGPDLQAGTN
jgi:hypothetical protein